MILPIGHFAWSSALLALLAQPVQAQTLGAAITAWVAQTQAAMSGLSISTRQSSVSSSQKSSAAHGSFKALADTILTTNANLGVVRANQAAVSTETTGGGLCANVQVGTAALSAEEVANTVRTGVSDYERDWRESGGSQAILHRTQLELRQDVFCSEAEFERGLCSTPPDDDGDLESAEFPAADTNAASFMLRRSYGSTNAMNGLNYIDTIAPMETYDPSRSNVMDNISSIGAVQNMTWYSVARGVVADIVGRGTEGE